MLRSLMVLLTVLAVASPAVSQDGKAVKPTNLDKLNTEKDETDPHLASNGLALYYSSNAAGKFDILVSKRASATSLAWSRGKPLADYVQTRADDRSCFVTPEGRFPQFLYYATKKDPDTNNFDIYVAVKQGANSVFSSPTPINAISTEQDEMHPWLTADGKQLYFSRRTKEGWRIYLAVRKAATGAAGFGAPVLLDWLPAGFHHTTLTPDGKTMYVQGPLEKDRWGLFRCSLSGTAWSMPEPLEKLNDPSAPTGDQAPALSRDGSTLYFASDRPGGKGGLDLWMVPTAQLTKKSK